MELLLGNLAFSLVTKVGSTALALGLLMWAGLKGYGSFAKPKKKHYRLAKRGCSFLWIVVVGWVAFTVLQANSPRMVIQDYGKQRPEYAVPQGGVRNLDPNTKTDEERVQDTRNLQRENEIEE